MAAFDPKNIPNLNDYLSPNTNSDSDRRLGAFGGESFGFARGISEDYARNFYSNKSQPDGLAVPKNFSGELPRSIFNRFALFNYSGFFGNPAVDNSDGYRDTAPASRTLTGRNIDSNNPTVASIINFYNENYPSIGYRAQDFLYAKYYRKIPLNHLVTLRRFPLPCEDNIYDYQIAEKQVEGGKSPTNVGGGAKNIDATQVAGVTAITYMGETAGNQLSEILGMSFGLKWKELASQMNEIQQDQGYTSQPWTKAFGGFAQALADAGQGVSAGERFRRQNDTTADRLGTTYSEFVIGPVNVIDTTQIRDRGLTFTNDIKLNFEYELKSLNYVNPKMAMIDIISNMLTMSTNNAQFWGGGQRYLGAAGYVGSQYGNVDLLKKGDFGGYTNSLVTDVTSGLKNIFGNSEGGWDLKSVLAGGTKVAETFLGSALGDLLGNIAGDKGQTAVQRTFISGEPTGNWHLTVGNPLNPIVMMGNLYCDNTTMTLGDGLGYDDFPMEVKFEVNLKHGKPRDKGDIENMFNIGRGRIYASAVNEQDILNLAGIDVQTYGSVKAGTQNLQATQGNNGAGQDGTVSTGPAANSTPDGELTNVTDAVKSSIKSSIDRGDEYINNLVSLMIDS